MEPVCAAWAEVRSSYYADQLGDVVDALKAGDYVSAAIAWTGIADSAAVAQRELRDVPTWNQHGTEYVKRLRASADALRAYAVASSDLLLSYPFFTNAEKRDVQRKSSVYDTRSTSVDRMETVLKERYGFDCPAWLSAPMATPMASPSASPGAGTT